MSKPQTLLFEQAIRSHLLEQEKKNQFLSKTYQAMREATDKFVTEEALIKIAQSCMLTEANGDETALTPDDFGFHDAPTRPGVKTKPDQKSKLKQAGAMAKKTTAILMKVATYISDIFVRVSKRQITYIVLKQQDVLADILVEANPDKLRLNKQMVKAGLEKYVKITMLKLAKGDFKTLGKIIKGILIGGAFLTGGASAAIGAAAKSVIVRMFGDKALSFIQEAVTDIIKVAATGDKSGTKYGNKFGFDIAVSFFNRKVASFVNNKMFPYLINDDPDLSNLQEQYNEARRRKGLEALEPNTLPAVRPQDPFDNSSQTTSLTRENKKTELQEQKVYNRWQLIAGVK